MPRKALDELAKAHDAGTAGSRESLSRPAPLTSEGDSLLPSGRRGEGARAKALALADAETEF